MGSGSSVNYELSGDQKVALTKLLEEKYQALQSEATDEIKTFEALKLTFEEGQQAIIAQNKAKQSSIVTSDGLSVDKVVDEEDDEVDENDFNLFGSVVYQPFNSSGSLRTMNKPTSADDPPGTLIRARTSSQLIDMAKESVEDDQRKIADFINQIKSGALQTQTTSEFRTRRLTYSAKTEDEVSTPTKVVFKNNSPPTTQTRKSAVRAIRTTIFASSEIGTVTEKPPPFPDNALGTYSCHGIEPGSDEEGGIHEKINQDRACVVCPYNSKRNEALFMVLDGHGSEGDKVSEFVMRQIVVSLEKDALLNSDPVTALKSTFVQTNAALLVTKINYVTSGCTCVAVYVQDQRLYVANVGDSRAVMAYKPTEEQMTALLDSGELAEVRNYRAESYGGEDGAYDRAMEVPASERYVARDLSRDHKPDDPEEMARITAWGGFVCPPPEPGLSARVYLDPGFTMIGLAMARSIGDHAVKAVGVIPEPEVKVFDLQESDQFMIMASDGVWEFISSQEAVDIVQKHLHRGYHEACQELIETAAARWQEEEGDYRDDISAIVVKFPLPYNMN